MSLEKMDMGASLSEKIDQGPEAAMLPHEKEVKLKEEIKVSYEKLRELSNEFSILSEEDYFESRQKLEAILDKIKDVKKEQQIMVNKLEEALSIKKDFSKAGLEESLENDQALKN